MHRLERITLDSVDSTNNYLKENKDLMEKNYLSVRAISQIEGRGRNCRKWDCKRNLDLACTTVFEKNVNPVQLQTVSVYAGIAVLRTMKDFIKDDSLFLKWPNDLYCRGKKLSGILCELVENKKGIYTVLIGTGLNINSRREADGFISMRDICGHEFDIELIYRHLHENQFLLLEKFEYPLNEKVLNEWKVNTDSIGKRVEFITDGSVEKGTIVDVYNDCSLLIKNKNNKIRYLGEVIFQ